ncbi:Uncharacterised protein [Fusobacterium necrogenes]|uniref:MORN repeat variant n=1 Tax=Fusobacterium necrogenes TaxID=858 RepID=A0A377GP78_9FUSO|nr:hypothetical protein [Fusobacterium necrogenes]STO28758.1 Uncharacterised protein [Fusobacterium necrogenes]
MIKKIFSFLFEKNQEIKEEKKEIKLESQKIKQENQDISYPIEYIAYYEDGVTIKEKGMKNALGIDGWVTRYDRLGNEIEKVQYSNGLYLGNPFTGKTPDEIADELGLLVDETGDYNDFSGEEFIIDEKVASTLLKQ